MGRKGFTRTACSIRRETKERNTVGVKRQDSKERCFRKAMWTEQALDSSRLG